ncbi:hypothetical protein [Acinetobacter baumannii]|uniref:hypothetical protein n=1 Tax=Acinetobacter baumannii TaxID=470 RepID=UPI003B434E2E
MPKPHPYLGQLQHSANQDQSQSRAAERAFNIPAQSPNDPIKLLLDDLATKTGAIQFGTAEEPRFVPIPAATAINIGFSDVVPSPVVSNNTLANMLFENDMLRAAVYDASAYLKAGVKLAVIADPNADTTREIIQAQHTFCSAEPLNYEFLADGTSLTDQPSPFAFQGFKIAEEASVGATFTLSRRTLKDTPQFSLNGLLYDAIAGGIGKAIDKAMAAHLGSLTLAPFTLAAAANRGLSMGDIVGITSGSSTDATLDRGELFLKGVKAHLCAATGSYILAPGKFAVAVPQDLRITAKRLNNGAVEFTVWTNVEVLATAQSNTAVWSA